MSSMLTTTYESAYFQRSIPWFCKNVSKSYQSNLSIKRGFLGRWAERSANYAACLGTLPADRWI
jgi:hypothetical protein